MDRPFRIICGLFLAIFLGLNGLKFGLAASSDEPPTDFFETKIRPVLVQHCYECHSADSKSVKAGLRLDTRAATLSGGDSGPSVVPGDVDASLLIEALKYDGMKMPPKGKLPEEVIANFVKWVEMGAPDPRAGETGPVRAGIDFPRARQFWAFQTPGKPDLPSVKKTGWPQSSIDYFTLSAMEAHDLTPVDPAGKQELIRRAKFDLLGLPPTPEEIDTFLADHTPEAFARVVEQFLGSAHYGERWGRYWLDVARYSEDQAHTFDVKPSTSGYRYRDWVIQAFNADLPYDQFVKQQIAADLLPRQEETGLAHLPALGYFGLGAQYYKNTDAAKAAADELDDRIDTLTRGFLGLTVSCARCHDHKFDPIPQQDYYSLAGVFQSSRLSDSALVAPEVIEQYNQGQEIIRKADGEFKQFLDKEKPRAREANIASVARYIQAAWKLRLAKLEQKPLTPLELASANGLDVQALERWLKFLDAKNQGKHPALLFWFALKPELEPTENRSLVSADVTAAGNAFQTHLQMILDERDGKPVAATATASATQAGTARFASIHATKPNPVVEIDVDITGAKELYLVVSEAGNGNSCDHADWLEPRLIGPDGEKKLTELPWRSATAASGSVNLNKNGVGQGLKVAGKGYENGIGTHALSIIAYDLPAGFTRLKALGGLDNSGTDQGGDCGENARVQFRVYTQAPNDLGTESAKPALAKEKAELLAEVFGENGVFAINNEQLEKSLDDAGKAKYQALKAGLDSARKAAPEMYPVSHGLAEGTVADMPVFLRGNPANKGENAPRRFLKILAGDEPPAFKQGSGRLELASAVADPQNPLTARVMVNRVWQHHFGRGIVGTPDNFGTLGDPPTHPELLDHLTRQFIESGWSVKQLHREIMLSATYQLSTNRDDHNLGIDADNRYLWRMSRRRLDVEAWRDALLAVSGRLDRSLGGPSTNLADAGNVRRTVYAKISRHELDGMLRLFDFPDANITNSKRSETTVPQQQLFVLNSQFMVEQAKALAARLQAEGSKSLLDKIQDAFLLAYGRPPTADELKIGQAYLQGQDPEDAQPGTTLSRWERYAQVLLGSNEFMYLD